MAPFFLKRYFFICSTSTSNKCFFIIIRSTEALARSKCYTPFYKTPLKWIPHSKSGASKPRPCWVAHTRIGPVWELGGGGGGGGGAHTRLGNVWVFPPPPPGLKLTVRLPTRHPSKAIYCMRILFCSLNEQNVH